MRSTTGRRRLTAPAPPQRRSLDGFDRCRRRTQPGRRRFTRIDEITIGDGDRLALALRHLDQDVDDLLPTRTVGLGQLIEIDHQIDVLGEEGFVGAYEQLLARHRDVAEIADTHHVLNASAFEQFVPQGGPVLFTGVVRVAGEQLEGLIEISFGEVSPPDQDVRLFRRHRLSPCAHRSALRKGRAGTENMQGEFTASAHVSALNSRPFCGSRWITLCRAPKTSRSCRWSDAIRKASSPASPLTSPAAAPTSKT